MNQDIAPTPIGPVEILEDEIGIEPVGGGDLRHVERLEKPADARCLDEGLAAVERKIRRNLPGHRRLLHRHEPVGGVGLRDADHFDAGRLGEGRIDVLLEAVLEIAAIGADLDASRLREGRRTDEAGGGGKAGGTGAGPEQSAAGDERAVWFLRDGNSWRNLRGRIGCEGRGPCSTREKLGQDPGCNKPSRLHRRGFRPVLHLI